MHSLKFRVVIQMILLLGLSWASGYEIRFPDSNWDTTLFLTPVGIIQNFWTGSTLATFYFDPSRGQSQLSWLMLAFYVGILVNGWLMIRLVRAR